MSKDESAGTANGWTRFAETLNVVWPAARGPVCFVVGVILAFQQAFGAGPADPAIIMFAGTMVGVGGLLTGVK